MTDASPPETKRSWWSHRPRPETSLLVISLLWTLGAKFAIIQRQNPEAIWQTFIKASYTDVMFFSGIWLLFLMLYLLRLPSIINRLALLIASIILGWSVLNAAWLLADNVQLQPGILMVLLQSPGEFWPIVQENLLNNLEYAVPILLTLFLGCAWIIWRFIRPFRKPVRWTMCIRCGALAVVLFAGAGIGHHLHLRRGTIVYSGEVIAHSSHWYALVQLISDMTATPDVGAVRYLPRAGERELVVPDTPEDGWPNVVIIFLESVSYPVTSLSETEAANTPILEQLASEGIQFNSTYVPVPQTNKAFWAGMTGITPVIQPDFAEAVLADQPYESLATILGRAGYRSGFFQLTKGTFECGPGLFNNLGFDWAWFLENIEDDSVRLSALTSDDFKMIEPMFQWVDEGDEPFLLGLISTVAHYPYVVPDWYDPKPIDDRYLSYLRTVEYTDYFLGAVCDQLKQRGLLDSTLLCVIGDHGDAFRPGTKVGRLTPYEEVIRIPWIIRWPGKVEAGKRVDWPCSQLDATPTLLSLLGFGIESAGFDGVNALKPTDPQRRLYFSTWVKDSPVGYIEGDRKFVYWPYTNKLFVYDLSNDPQEISPSIINDEVKDQVREDLQQWAEQTHLIIPLERFRQRILYEHWRTFCQGRSAWAYYDREGDER